MSKEYLDESCLICMDVSLMHHFHMNIESDAPGYFALSFVVASYPGKEA